jgi:hypothetical protein
MFLQRRKRHVEPLELRFGVAAPRQWATASVAPGKLIRNLDDAFATPQQLLREALFQMRGMNRVNLSSARRLKLCLIVQRRVWPTLNAARDALRSRDNGVPEPQTQQELLDLADQMALALIAGFQIVIEGDYRADDSHGRTEHARILEGGVRALELVHLQQRLRALRYQPLPATSWQLANTLFCVIARADDLETPVSAITTDRTVLDANGHTQVLRLYRAVQSFGLFDTFSWCKPQQHFLDTYCATLPNAVSIGYAPQPLSGADSEAESGPQSWPQPDPVAGQLPTALSGPSTGRTVRHSHAHQEGPPAETPPADKRHCIVIDFSGLADTVRADKEAAKHTSRHGMGDASTRLSGLSPPWRRPMMRSMLRSLERERTISMPTPRDQVSDSAASDAQPPDFRLETGMERIRRHLQAVFTSDEAMKQHLLRNDVFAGRSSTMGDDASNTGGTGWHLLRESAHHTLIQTRETRYTKQIALGALAIYGVGLEGFSRPRLGTIKRLVRLEPDSLYVEVKQLARFAATVSIASATGGDVRQGANSGDIACLLVYDDDLEWCIVTSPPTSLRPGWPIQIRTRRLQVDTRLRQLTEITPHLLMFQLDAQSPRLGTPRYPDMRRRCSQLTMASHLYAESQFALDAQRKRRGAS